MEGWVFGSEKSTYFVVLFREWGADEGREQNENNNFVTSEREVVIPREAACRYRSHRNLARGEKMKRRAPPNESQSLVVVAPHPVRFHNVTPAKVWWREEKKKNARSCKK